MDRFLRILAVLAIALAVPFVIRSLKSDNKAPVSPEMDSSGFVNLTDVVPDAIIEARYFATYNFVGARVDGYLEPYPDTYFNFPVKTLER